MRTRPYRPGNGMEGRVFDENWCSQCARDKAWRDDERNEPCRILSGAMAALSIDDPLHPAEWIEDDLSYDQDTHPRCTAFVAIGEDLELKEARDDPRQIALPL